MVDPTEGRNEDEIGEVGDIGSSKWDSHLSCKRPEFEVRARREEVQPEVPGRRRPLGLLSAIVDEGNVVVFEPQEKYIEKKSTVRGYRRARGRVCS